MSESTLDALLALAKETEKTAAVNSILLALVDYTSGRQGIPDSFHLGIEHGLRHALQSILTKEEYEDLGI